jgi:NAD-dependent dihydropyrimidine dehydrogenase PreA subunit
MTYLKNVTSLTLSREKCIGCGICLTVCPHGVFALDNGKAAILKRDNCMECGACMVNCPTKALEVKKGVGCAFAVIYSKLKGLDEITCDCGGQDTSAAKIVNCCGGSSSSGSSCCSSNGGTAK